MRENQRDNPHDRWVLSTNRPHRLVGSLWVFNGGLYTFAAVLFSGVYLLVPITIQSLVSGILVFLLGVLAIYFFGGGLLLRHDSRTIRKDPFPEGSTCKGHPNQLAYDWCAICGALQCTQDLVRIRQSLRFSSGMFGFDGVACQRCAQRRAKRFLAISAGFELASLPLVTVVFVITSTILPAQLGLLLLIILGVIVFTLLPLGIWAWRKRWRTFTTPLATQPLLMTPTAERLAEKAMVGDTIRYKRVAVPST